MKKTMLVGMAMMCVVGMMGQAGAADTGTISVTVSLAAVISVSVAPSTWTIGPVALGSSSSPAAFAATVGNVATNLQIIATDGAGGWTIGATPGANTFEVSVASPAIALSKVYQTLTASVAPYGSQAFSLTYLAPASDTKGGGVDQSFSVTVKASAP